ncbi:unnamed protein product [Leuciscus chuanchicus]
MCLDLAPSCQHKAKRRKRLDVSKLRVDSCHINFCQTLSNRLSTLDNQAAINVEETWSKIRDITYNTAAEVLGFTTSKHKDWFDDQDVEAQALLNTMHTSHLAWVNDKSSTAKSAYTRARNTAQTCLREMKNRWWQSKAEELQSAADRHDMKTFYHGLKAVHGPLRAGSTPVLAIDGTLLTDKAEILRCWVDHFQLVLNQPAAFDDSVLGDIAQWPTASDLDDTPSPGAGKDTETVIFWLQLIDRHTREFAMISLLSSITNSLK